MAQNNKIAIALALALAAGCGETDEHEDTGSTCLGGKCDASEDDVADALEGRSDPIARALSTMTVGSLRLATPDERSMHPDLRFQDDPDTIMTLALEAEADPEFPAGLGAFLALVRAAGSDSKQCSDDDAFRTFVIADDLLGAQGVVLPRVIASTCADDSRKMANAFFALSFPDADGDVNGREIEAFAWDKGTRKYNFYRATPLLDSDEGVLITTNPLDLQGHPEFGPQAGGCDGCHGPPPGVEDPSIAAHVPLLPIMNELVEPWSHWNAEPGFRSQQFDIPNLESKPKLMALTLGEDGKVQSTDRIDSAGAFETIVKKGLEQVAKQRRKTLKADGTTQEALALLHPLFCEEQVNYASEVGMSGDLRLGAVLDEGIRQMLIAAKVDGSWAWMTGAKPEVQVAEARARADALELVPMRGQADVIFEETLVTSLSDFYGPEELLQIRALDWQTPVLSDLRCSLWESVATDAKPASGTNYEIMQRLLEKMLTLPGGVRLQASAEDRVIVLDGSDPDLVDALARDLETAAVPVVECSKGGACDYSICEDTGYCEMNLFAYGERIDDYVRAFQSEAGREALREARDERLCRIAQEGGFPAQPALPKDFRCE